MLWEQTFEHFQDKPGPVSGMTRSDIEWGKFIWGSVANRKAASAIVASRLPHHSAVRHVSAVTTVESMFFPKKIQKNMGNLGLAALALPKVKNFVCPSRPDKNEKTHPLFYLKVYMAGQK